VFLVLYFHNVTENDVLTNARFLAENREKFPVRYVQLDDGYEPALGDWLDYSDQFPNGLAKLAENIRKEVLSQTQTLSRREIIERVIEKDGILIVVAPDLVKGMEIVNDFAPEHFEIMTKNSLSVMKGVRAAGAVFVGPWTPESAGDFVAGPSHVLPTGGAAKMFNGLTPDDFRRRHSFVSFTKKDLEETAPSIAAFASVEGLSAHGNAAAIRLVKKRK
jgi:histidinol dehydrogenase